METIWARTSTVLNRLRMACCRYYRVAWPGRTEGQEEAGAWPLQALQRSRSTLRGHCLPCGSFNIWGRGLNLAGRDYCSLHGRFSPSWQEGRYDSEILPRAAKIVSVLIIEGTQLNSKPAEEKITEQSVCETCRDTV
jgi:hypothetical protein